MKKLIKQIVAISVTLANTVYASLSWSGGTRLVNAMNDTFSTPEDCKLMANIAGLANNITTKEIKPTVDSIIELLKSSPELLVADTEGLKKLATLGMDTSAVTGILAQDFKSAEVRHAKQLKALAANETNIREALQTAFDTPATADVFDKLPTQLEEALTKKVFEKVHARRSRLIVDISTGRFMEAGIVELTAINKFLDANTPTAAVA